MSKRKTYTDEFRTLIAELVLSGKAVKDVASEYSLSETAVRNWLRRKPQLTQKEIPQTSRNTVISTLIDEGMNIDAVRRFAGHEDTRTLLTSYCFSRLTDEQNEALIEKALCK